MKKILLIGGGTGGHIFPLRNLITELKKKKAHIHLIVADAPLDRKIVEENFEDVPTTFFQTGKIRRYLSFKNIPDSFRILTSCWNAKKILKEINPDVLFFKGGFVGFPFLVAAKFLMRFKGKIYSHESDISVGAMTRMASKFADTTFESFSQENPMPLFYQPHSEIKPRKPKIPGNSQNPHILIFGGSQGAEFINILIEEHIETLTKDYRLTLVSGLGKRVYCDSENFQQFDFLPVDTLAQYIHSADLILSRAGSNSLFEIISAQKPSIIIPLPSVARDHQRLNAEFFEKQGLCRILEQNKEASQKLIPLMRETLQDKKLIALLEKSTLKNSADTIATILSQS